MFFTANLYCEVSCQCFSYKRLQNWVVLGKKKIVGGNSCLKKTPILHQLKIIITPRSTVLPLGPKNNEDFQASVCCQKKQNNCPEGKRAGFNSSFYNSPILLRKFAFVIKKSSFCSKLSLTIAKY